MKLKRLLSLIGLTLLVAACNHTTPTPDAVPSENEGSATSQAAKPVNETPNVSYRGIVQPAGMSMYMEGTHRLRLDDGRFVLLESSAVDLNGYVGESVELMGAIRPTVEGDAVIMRVQTATLLEEPAEEEETSEEAEEESSEASEVESSVAETEVENTEVAEEAEESEESSAAATASVVHHRTPAFEARIAMMADEDFSAENWTREYCSSHIGFCVPVHRNWWFRSFGATEGSLWHIEMNSEEFEMIGQGPIVVELKAGSLGSTGFSDGQLAEAGNDVIGYRDWDSSRHFEVRGDLSLRGAVEYITTQLASAPEGEDA